jgi:ABC-2 type transport system ATP-binding protein
LYQVGVLTDDVQRLIVQLSQKFKMEQTSFKSLNNELQLEIDLGSAMPNELLHLLSANGQVTHFMEKLPTVNDIFIQTVSK